MKTLIGFNDRKITIEEALAMNKARLFSGMIDWVKLQLRRKRGKKVNIIECPKCGKRIGCRFVKLLVPCSYCINQLDEQVCKDKDVVIEIVHEECLECSEKKGGQNEGSVL